MDNETGIVKEAKATRMTYYVKYETETEQEFANRWFTSVTEALEKYIEETGEEVRLGHITRKRIRKRYGCDMSCWNYRNPRNFRLSSHSSH